MARTIETTPGELPPLSDEQKALFIKHLESMKNATPSAIRELLQDVQAGRLGLEVSVTDAAEKSTENQEVPEKDQIEIEQEKTEKLLESMGITQQEVDDFSEKALGALQARFQRSKDYTPAAMLATTNKLGKLIKIQEGLQSGLLKKSTPDTSNPAPLIEQSTPQEDPQEVLFKFIGAESEAKRNQYMVRYIAITKNLPLENAKAIVNTYNQLANRDSNGLNPEQLVTITPLKKLRSLFDMIANGATPKAVNDAVYEEAA